MPLDNTLNVSELLRRLGVKGDSLGSASLLEALRLNLIIGDLSDLVPPLGVPMGGASINSTSGVATFNKWQLECRSPGGLTVRTLRASQVGSWNVFVTAANPFGATVATAANDFAFGQAVRSIYTTHTPAAQVAPANSFQFSNLTPSLGIEFDNWIGPGEFFNIESRTANIFGSIAISWKEYPAALNPG